MSPTLVSFFAPGLYVYGGTQGLVLHSAKHEFHGGQKTRETFDIMSPTLLKMGWGWGWGHVPSTLSRGGANLSTMENACAKPLRRGVRARLRENFAF